MAVHAEWWKQVAKKGGVMKGANNLQLVVVLQHFVQVVLRAARIRIRSMSRFIA